ncbi:carotenoid oxygenase family protein [Aquihabitans sp. G128]|uniref:carotenoid oxygenase family protein n=1 Tax=Aquihabitans sp. G128 TaxID=2849779 RepID=UPI001C220C25|nr:carotenoid oxygenase family protein [Aquihabitans sp. G128]QXC60423.1 carotenoid oxygenase family protein [Aquihabitans sp. G128]
MTCSAPSAWARQASPWGGLGLLAGCASDDDPRATGSPSSTAATTTSLRASAGYDPDVPYWEQGNFAPVTTEETFTDLRVKGSIPAALSGLFVRNGSNPPTGRSLHWFLGDGMVHGVQLGGGRAKWYRNRYVRTPPAGGGQGPARVRRHPRQGQQPVERGAGPPRRQAPDHR